MIVNLSFHSCETYPHEPMIDESGSKSADKLSDGKFPQSCFYYLQLTGYNSRKSGNDDILFDIIILLDPTPTATYSTFHIFYGLKLF